MMSDTIEVWRIRPPHCAGDVMRIILARYANIPADKLALVTGKNGKPYLDAAQNERKLAFNFSDSGDLALLAVSWNRELGVDVEKVREVKRATEIARRRFSPQAADELAEIGDGSRSRVFLQAWARYEALLKARAGSIWSETELGNLTFPGPAMQVKGKADFTVRDLDTGHDYVGALAAQGNGWTVAVKDYTD